MDGHGALAAQGRLPPDGLIEGLGGVDLAGVGHEQVEDGVLRRGQAHALSLHGDGFGPVVHGDAADGQAVRLRLMAAETGVPPQLGPDPGQDLHGDKGLGDVVVGSYVEPQYLVLGFGLGGEQNNGHIGKFPDLRRGGHAVHNGHHHVQQYQMDALLLHGLHRLGPVLGLVKLIALRGQINFQSIDNVRLIVANEYLIHTCFLPLLDFEAIIPLSFLTIKGEKH